MVPQPQSLYSPPSLQAYLAQGDQESGWALGVPLSQSRPTLAQKSQLKGAERKSLTTRTPAKAPAQAAVSTSEAAGLGAHTGGRNEAPGETGRQGPPPTGAAAAPEVGQSAGAGVEDVAAMDNADAARASDILGEDSTSSFPWTSWPWPWG
uniref:Uncharacterized protein n=1 Tax=Rhizochromulina marina TaxID=1034831 RepID=A0A7S2WWM8_9STRA|mmetsp:Transcript_847/g.2725  ORF Transcript_847/g.2725 Transcript_847/m.2725 type:complete len:151 (+) Transcript_847:116-568(+)